MKKQLFIEKLKEIKLIAHRLGYKMTNYPENSIEALKSIFKNKELLNSCYGFEFDICFSKDHIPVVIHDKYVDDITNNYGLVKNYTLKELKEMKFTFRKSLKNNTNSTQYKITTLEEILMFFNDNIHLLENKIIKIETKDYIFASKNNFNLKNFTILANIINKFPNLSENIVHLSFWPLNLFLLKKIQKKNNYKIIKNDLLCDYDIVVFSTRFMPFLDNISLRIKSRYFVNVDNNNSKRVNNKIKFNLFWIRFANTAKEKNLNYAIKKYGTVGIYVLNDYKQIDELCNYIEEKFFINNLSNIIITTNDPIYFKSN